MGQKWAKIEEKWSKLSKKWQKWGKKRSKMESAQTAAIGDFDKKSIKKRKKWNFIKKIAVLWKKWP